jgi:hypothetical protein
MRVGAKHPVSTSSVHEAGVTSLHSNAFFEHLLASGRYAKTPKYHSFRIPCNWIFSVFIGGFIGGKMDGTFDYVVH